MRILLVVLAACLLALSESARPSIRPRVREPQVYYEEQADNQAAEDGDFESIYQPRTRALPSARSKESLQPSKAPPVQTIRNYNKVNDDGSFTFGYEAADGSFKEETRGTDCVVRGKYGYIDPDGNKREFTYVSGNPCDPNAPKEEDDDLPEKQEEDELSGPANYPSVRPVPIQRPIRPTYQPSTTRAPTTIFQTQYQLDDEASQELEEEIQKPVQLRPAAFRKPQQSFVPVSPSTALYEPSPTNPSQLYRIQSTSSAQYQTTAAPTERTPSTIAPLAYQSLESSTRRPTTRQPARPQSVAITPRPHISQVAAQYVSPSSTERSIAYNAQSRPAPSTSNHLRTSTGPSTAAHLDFAAELERYVNTIGVPSKSAQQAALSPSRTKLGQTTVTTVPAEPIYQSELIYDPATGQYNTQLYQTLPQTLGDFSLSHKLQPFVAQPQSLFGLQQLQQIQQQQQQIQQQQQQHQHQQQQQQQAQRQSSLYRHQLPQAVPSASASAVSVAQPQEMLYRKQQTQLLMQSQNLYAQQQQRRQQQQQQQQPHRLQLLESQRDPQAFYYVAPARSAGGASAPLTASQIDQYLRSSAANNY